MAGKYPNLRLRVNSVVTPDNIGEIRATVDYFYARYQLDEHALEIVRDLSWLGALAPGRVSSVRRGPRGGPRGGPFVLVANHASYVDTLALIALVPLDFVFVAKREVLSWPVVGTFVRRQRHPTVDRWDPKQSVADAETVNPRHPQWDHGAVLP